MGFQKIDKQQLPQLIGLGAASVGMFGYFAYKMIVPTVSAAPPPASKTVQAVPGAAAATTTASGTGTASAIIAASPDAPPPTPGMRDPFIPTITDQDAPPTTPAAAPAHNVQMASAQGIKADGLLVPPAPLPSPNGRGGEAPVLPPPGGSAADIPTPDRLSPSGQPTGILAPMPAAPAWTVTGVLQGDGEQVAILRSGVVRQFAHQGDIVGGNFRVVAVARQYVVLRHGSARYTLPLGGPKTPVAKPRQAAQPSGSFAADPPAPAPTAEEQTVDQAAQERQQLQGTVAKLGATPQGTADSALTQVNSALNHAQDLIEKH